MAIYSGGLIHIILFVQDMSREVWFYRDVLGLPLKYPSGIEDYSKEMWVEFELEGCVLALHGGSQTEPGHTHEIVFTVADLEKSRAAIEASGIQIGRIRELEDGAFIAEGIDPAGHRFAIRSEKAGKAWGS